MIGQITAGSDIVSFAVNEKAKLVYGNLLICSDKFMAVQHFMIFVKILHKIK